MASILVASIASMILTPAALGRVDPKGPVVLNGVSWLRSFEEAKRQAQASGKPILHLQMFGSLDEEFC